MLSAENLASIETDGRTLGRIARENPETPVPQYPGWTLEDLANHLGWVHGRIVLICREHPQERISGPRCPPGTSVLDWYDRTLDELLEALATSDPSTPVWGFGDITTIGFWERRMAIETGVHRWDAEQAIGGDRSLSDHVAASGLDEFPEVYLPHLGAVSPIALVAADLGSVWQMGLGEPNVEVTGTASDIYLRLVARSSPVILPDDWARAVDGLSPPPKP